MSLNTDTATAFSVAVRQAHLQEKDERGQRSMVLALLATVVAVDQATKWWAWRNASGPIINQGASPYVGTTVSAWYEDRVSGALLDVLAVGLLGVAVSVLARRRRPVLVLIPGALMIGGWTSNLLDRLGMHQWTAPSSARGAVDFIPLGPISWNVADLFIVVGTSMCLLVAAWAPRRSRTRLRVGENDNRHRPCVHDQVVVYLDNGSLFTVDNTNGVVQDTS